MTNKKSFKRFLTTASALGMIAVGAQEASAGAGAAFPVAAGSTAGAVVGGGANNYAQFNQANTVLDFAAGDALVGGVLINHGINGSRITVSADGGTLGAVAAAVGGVEKTTLAVNGDLTLIGDANSPVVIKQTVVNNYSGISAVTIANGKTLTIAMAGNTATFNATFDGAFAGKGTLISQNDGNIFTGNIGNIAALAGLVIDGNTTIGGAGSDVTVVQATLTTIAANKTLTIDTSGNAITYTGDITSAAPGGNGSILAITGNRVATFAGSVGLVGGLGLDSITLDANSQAVFTKGNVTTKNGVILGAGSTMTVDSTGATGAMIVGSKILGKAATNGILIVKATDQNVTFNGIIGGNSINALNIQAVSTGKTLAFGNAITTDAGGVSITSAAGSIVNFGDAITTGNGGNFDASNAAGAVNLNAAGLNTIDGTFKSGAGVVVVNNALTVNKTLTTGAGKLTVTTLTTVNNTVAKGVVVPVDGVVIGAGGVAYSGGLTVGAGNFNLTGDTSATGSRVDGALTMSAAGSQIKPGVNGLVVSNALTFTKGGVVDVTSGKLILIGANNVTAGVGYSADIIGKGTLQLGSKTHAAGIGGGAANYTGTIQGNIGAVDAHLTSIIVSQGLGGTNAVIGGVGSKTTGIYTDKTIFDQASQLTVDATANSIVYTGTIDGLADDQGTLSLTAGVGKVITVQGAIGDTFKLHAVNTGGGGTTIFEDIVGAKTLTANAGTTTFLKDVKGAILALANPTLNFGSGAKADITVNGDGANTSGIGANGAPVGVVNLNLGGGTLTIGSGAVNITTLNFKSDDTFTINQSVAGGVSIAGITTTADGTGTVNMNAANGVFNVTGDIGSANAKLKAFNFGANTTLNVTAGKNVYTDISGAGMTINVNGAGASTFGSVGTATAAVTSFVTAVAGGTATLDNLYSNKTTNLGTIVLNDKGTLRLGTYTTAGGIIILTDNATIGDIGAGNAVATLNMNSVKGNATVTLDGSTINATTFNQQGNTLKLNQNTTITGTTYNLNGAPTINTNGKTLNMQTGIKVNSAVNLIVTLSDAPNVLNVGATAPDFGAGGSLVLSIAPGASLAQNGAAMNLFGVNGTNNIVIATIGATHLTANQVTVTTTAGNNFRFTTFSYVDAAAAAAAANDPTVVAATAAKTATAQAVVTAQNNLAAAPAGGPNIAALQAALQAAQTADAAAQQKLAAAIAKAGLIEGTIKVVHNATTDNLLPNVANVSPAFKAFVSDLASGINDGTITGDGARLASALSDANDSEAVEILNGVYNKSPETNTVTATSQTVNALATSASNAIGGASTAGTGRLVTLEGDGVAGGDASERFGIWGQFMGTVSTQKQRKELSGFETRGGGILVGFDTMVNDNTTFGMLASTIRNNITFKDSNAGSKAAATSFIFGAYGNYDIGATDFFVQGNLTVAQTAINAKAKRLVGAGGQYQTAKSKYDILGLGAELVGGYKYKFDTSYIAPSVGLRFNYFGDTSYTGTGLTYGNQDIKTKANKVVSGLLGVKFGTNVDMDGTNIMPEAHMNLSYAFNAPSTKTSFKLNGMNKSYTYTGPKASNFGVNGGFSVMAEADGFEYGAGYDATISDKYLGHQGTLKVRVKL